MLRRCFTIQQLFIALLAIVFFVTCQKELSPDPIPSSEGYLSKDSSGNCQSVVIGSNYGVGQKLSDSSYIEVEVVVTSPGSYDVVTDTVNGYSFKATGIFTNTGIMQVKLNGSGTPLVAETDRFTIQYNQTICEAIVIVVDSTVQPAVFTLEGAPGVCMSDTVYGSYIKGIQSDSSARVKINVNVITPGAYTINTNAINGYSFSGSGNFLSAGAQPVFLYASGTPSNAGADVFTVTAGNSTCSFSNDVLTAVNITGNDYYPLSYNSYWVYDDLINKGDTIKRTVIDSTNVNGYQYKIIREDVKFGAPFNYFIRKSGVDYFEYAAPNKFTTFFQYKKPVNADIPFLRENLISGSTWQSPEYIDTASTGDVISLKYNFTCLNADAVVTLNGTAFIHVYQIKMLPLVQVSGSNYAYTSEEYLFYYAKGIGMIYLKKTLGGYLQNELQIRNWQVH